MIGSCFNFSPFMHNLDKGRGYEATCSCFRGDMQMFKATCEYSNLGMFDFEAIYADI